MSDAQQLLITYGLIILSLGFLLGGILGLLRMKAPAVRNLAAAHVETLMQGSCISALPSPWVQSATTHPRQPSELGCL